MPPKKATPAATQKKAAAAPAHASYKDMIKEAILTLKDRSGSSRQAIKKYILANNKTAAATPTVFDTQFNKALRTGVEKGDFTQPKGTSGPVKLAKKDGSAKPAAPATKTAAPKKTTATKAAAPKKATAPKKTATKAAAPKKTATTKKAAAAKPKANTGTKRKTSVAGPAVMDVPKVLGKTKSGRVTKSVAKPAAPAKKAAPKKTAAKKSATPKKKAETTT
ncbi:MAG: hypothetical protein LQ347_002541 [Umbilicaria vellea]|nr:MAG: hypothetical protein LQ347_002541 [Umbilicaria vellea]